MRSKIGIGTVQFGMDYGISNRSGQTPPNEVSAILSYCTNHQIEFLDTAYGYGDSEKNLGKNDLGKFKIISKFLSPEDSIGIAEQLRISLERLGVQYLYGYLAHRPLQVLENPMQWEELKELKEQGKVKKIGFSFNDPKEIDMIIEARMIPDLVQVPFNFLDNRFTSRMIFLKDQYGCEIHTRSVFLQGLFFAQPSSLPNYFDSVKRILEKFLKDYRDVGGSLLKYALSKPFIDCVIFGINDLQQLRNNIDAIETAALPEDNSNLDFDKSILIPANWPKS